MFILKDQITAWWPVKVNEPDEKSAGRFVEHKFEVLFTLIDQDQAIARDEARSALIKDDGDPADIIRALQAFDAETFADRISDWRSVFNESKKEVPFSRDMLLLALKRPLIFAAIQRAYQEMASGELRRKN